MKKRAFTLVELVAVMVILAILLAVAAPKFLEANDEAVDASVRSNLRVLRDAIERHVAAHGKLPGDEVTEADLKSDLKSFLRKFPENPVRKLNTVYVRDTGEPFTGQQSGEYGWLYDASNGDIRANSDGLSADGTTRYYEF